MKNQNQPGLLYPDRDFLKHLGAIGLPIVLQQFLNTLLNFADTLMIGQLGESTIAAIGLANKVFFIFSIIVFGVCSGTGILAAQYWGRRDVANIRRAQGLALSFSLGVSLLFVLACTLAPVGVMGILTNSGAAIGIGASYLRIVIFSYPLTAVTQVYVASLRSVGQVRAPVVISIVAILVNVSLNYMLIFGIGPFPRLEAEGAALATLIARVVECCTLLFIVYRNDSPVRGSIREMHSFDGAFARLFFAQSTPVILNEVTWGLGVTMYSLVYGRMGDSATAAITVTQSVEQMAQVVFMGLSAACAVVLGNELGAGRLREAKAHAAQVLALQFVLALGTSGVFYLVRRPIIGLFALLPEVESLTAACLTVFCIFLPAKVFNLITVVGILRSGGDSRFALLMDLAGVWLIGVPLAWLGGLVWGLPIYLVYALVFTEEVCKVFVGLFRVLQGKWCRTIVQ